MRNLHRLENSALVDMLAEHTLNLTHLFRKGLREGKDYQKCKEVIQKIIMELDNRGLITKPVDSRVFLNETPRPVSK